ncbi:MAG: hypothetical protein HY922_14635 [Elusimicrobia bacterium]|nr:hypothetical protein [Elusimicrobiota bacterium]
MSLSAGRDRGRLIAAMACISVSATCLVCGYEFVRTTAASMFLEAFGSKNMPYAMTLVPVVMALLIFIYGLALSKLGGHRTLHASLASSALVFFACYGVLRSGHKSAVAALYIFTEAYIVIIVEQFWSFIDSTLNQYDAKVFNGPILGGASIGPIAGGLLLRRFAERIGSEQFVLLSGLMLIPTAALAFAAYRLAGEPQPSSKERPSALDPASLRLVFKSRILLLIAGVVFLSQVFATVGSLRFYQLLEITHPLKDARSAYLGTFWAATNCTAFFMQFVLTPLLLKRLPLAATLLGIPAMHLATSGLMLAWPVLPAAALSLLMFKAADYSIFRASKELLYIPLSYDARYRAKQVVDAFNYRFSKGATAGLISLIQTALGALPGWAYPAAGLAAAGTWLAAAVPLSAGAKP